MDMESKHYYRLLIEDARQGERSGEVYYSVMLESDGKLRLAKPSSDGHDDLPSKENMQHKNRCNITIDEISFREFTQENQLFHR